MKENILTDHSIKLSELDLKVNTIKIKRVTKVVKGGRVLSYSALVVAGDPEKNIVSIGFGKAKEVPLAIEKATNAARNNLKRIPILRGTIPHDIRVKYKGTHVLLKRAPQGKGVIAGGPMRMILEITGISNVLGKMRGSNNAYNVAIATLQALQKLHTPYSVARRSGISLQKVFNG